MVPPHQTYGLWEARTLLLVNTPGWSILDTRGTELARLFSSAEELSLVRGMLSQLLIVSRTCQAALLLLWFELENMILPQNKIARVGSALQIPKI